MRDTLRVVRIRIGLVWQGLRTLSGDAAWETYVARSGGRPQLTRKQFYLERMQHKYRRPCRCC